MAETCHLWWAQFAYVSDTSSMPHHHVEVWSGAPQTLFHLTRGFICIVIDPKVWLIRSEPSKSDLGDFRVVSNIFGHSGHIRKIRFSRFKFKIIKNGRWNKGCWNWKIWWDRFWILENANWRLFVWEETSSSFVGEQTREYARQRMANSW